MAKAKKTPVKKAPKAKRGRRSKQDMLKQGFADQIATLQKIIEGLQTQINELTKPEPVVAPTVRSTIINKTGNNKKGVSIMTKAASEIIDGARQRRRGPNPSYSNCTTKARPNE